jgi:hypothetical protein
MSDTSSQDLLRLLNLPFIIISGTEDGSCGIDFLRTALGELLIGGRPVPVEELIEYAIEQGLLLIDSDNRIHPTEDGQAFLRLNPKEYWELQPEQIDWLRPFLPRRGSIGRRLSSLIAQFAVVGTDPTLILSEEAHRGLNSELQGDFTALRILGLVTPNGANWILRLGHGFVLSEADLLESLEAQREFGRAAEEVALELERKRLRRLGQEVLAGLVRRISTVKANAGYDIESFSGASANEPYNRFIEVKAIGVNQKHFYMSRNELEIAAKLGDCFEIHAFVGFRPLSGAAGNAPIIIKDPAVALRDESRFRLSPESYRVTILSP